MHHINLTSCFVSFCYSLGIWPYCVRLLDLKKEKVKHFDPSFRNSINVEIVLHKSLKIAFCRENQLSDSFYEAGVESGQRLPDCSKWYFVLRFLC